MANIFSGKDCETESDVEQKLLYQLLTHPQGLGFFPEEVKTKQYLAPTDLDKGAGKVVGYYPDYGVVVSSLFTIVVEAKSPSESAEAGFREAQLYAHEINKRFPPDVNPAFLVVASNGVDLLYGYWDHDTPKRILVCELTPGLSGYEDFRAQCCRTTVLHSVTMMRDKLAPRQRFKPLKLIGGPSRQNQELEPNRFSSQLVPMLKKYFDPDATRTSRDLVKKAYVSTRDVTHYNAVLEALLKDNLSRTRFPLFTTLSTSKTDAPELNDSLRQLIEESRSTPDPLLLLIGGVGTGKSMFIDRYYYHLMDATIKANTVWAFVDLNNAPADLGQVDEWMPQQVLGDLPTRNSIDGFANYDNLCRYFAPDIDALRRQQFKQLEQHEFDVRIADKLDEWTNNPCRMLAGVIRYFSGDTGKKVVIVFDNADKRDASQQLRVFQAVQHFRSQYRIMSILSLRDETYERYKHEPPLDSFFKPFAFQITPPRFIDVVKRRLELVIEDLADNAPQKLSYTLENGIAIEYPATDLGKFIMGVYKSLFAPTRKLRLILEALAGRNVREALEMFVSILMSGYMEESTIFRAGFGSDGIRLPEWLVIKTLMRTKYRYFTSEHGYVLNVFDIQEQSKTTTLFLLTDILSTLSRDRKKQGELGIEGYRYVATLSDELAVWGYVWEDIHWGLIHLLKRRLIIADHQRTTDIARDDYVKVSASGHYHYRVLLRRPEYLASAAIDTWMRNRAISGDIANNNEDKRNHAILRMEKLGQALQEEAILQTNQALPHAPRSVAVTQVLEWIKEGIDRSKYPGAAPKDTDIDEDSD